MVQEGMGGWFDGICMYRFYGGGGPVVLRGCWLKYGKGLLGWLDQLDSLAAADALGSRETRAGVSVFCKLQLRALVIVFVGACLHAHLHALLYMCVGGVRHSHLRRMRSCNPSGMSQKEEDEQTEQKTTGTTQVFLKYEFENAFSPPHWHCDFACFYIFNFTGR